MIDEAARELRGDRGDGRQSRERPVPASQQQGADRLRICGGACDAHRHRHAAIGLLELRRHRAVVGRIQGLEHIGRLQAVCRQLIGQKLDVQLGLARRHDQAHVPAARQMLQHLDDLGADPVVRVQIRADHRDGERRGFPRQRLADALAQNRVDLDQLVRVVIEDIANGGIDVGGAAFLGIDLYLEFAFVGRIGVLTVLRAADLLGDAFDAGDGHETLGDLLTDPRSLGERDAGAKRGMGDQVILPKIRQQARAEQRQEHESRNAGRRQNGDEHARPPVKPRDRLPLSTLEVLQEARLGLRPMLRHHEHAHRGRRAHRNEQREPDRQQKRNGQRAEERALQARHHEDGQERDGHGGGRVEHRPAHFERCADEQGDDVATRRCDAPPAQDVLDVDDGVVDHDAERHHDPAQRHRVQRQSEGLEDPHRRQQGEGNRAERNQRAAPVAKRHEEQCHHQHRADQERVAQFLDRALDEARRPQERGMVFDALLGERRRERVEPLLEGPSDVERVRAKLRRGLDEYAGLARDECVAEARLAAVAHGGHVLEAHGEARARADDRALERLERGAGWLRANHDALRRCLEIARTDERGRAFRGREHIVESEACRRELGRVHLDLPLAHGTPENLSLRDSRDRQNLRLHDPLHDVAQLHRSEPIARVAEVNEVFHRGAQRR